MRFDPKLLIAAMAVALLHASPARGVETVRVDAGGGVPRILVDGRPVHARMFWGAPGHAPVAAGTEGEDLAFEFTARDDARGSGTIHFRFGQQPGAVVLDEIHIFDLATQQDVLPRCDFETPESLARDWTWWPSGRANTVAAVSVAGQAGRGGSGGLQIELKAPPDGHWPDFHVYSRPALALVKGHRYRVSLWLRATPARKVTIAVYRPGQPFVLLGGPADCFVRQIKLAAEAGVDFVSFPMPVPWPKPGDEVDWSPVDAACQRVLAANPRALLLPRVGMGPPRWWRDAHPEEMMVWDQPAPANARRPRPEDVVPSSPIWRRDVAQRLAALIEHVEARFGPHVAGYHPCGQNTGEWFYQATWGTALNGYAPADRRAWRDWLRKQYVADAALRRAWGDETVSLETAEVPRPEARRRAPAGILRDPRSERALIDFAQFQQEEMADCVCHLARTVRQASRGRKLSVFFYGYVFEFGPVQNGPATSGHYALRRVLASPDIDVLCSPISYFDRGLGQSAPAMTAAESVLLAGKLWLYEDDTHTYLSTGDAPGRRDRVETLEETNAQLVRNVAQEALRNFGTWWMDLGATGWFADPRMWAEMARLKTLDEPWLRTPVPFRPEVAAVVDEASMVRVAWGGSAVTRPGVYEVRRPLGRMGAPYGQYLLDDLLAGRVPARLVVLLDAWCLTPEQRARLLAAIQGRTRIWCYAPGYIDGDRFSPDAMQKLTGFRLRRVEIPNARAEPTAAGRQLGLEEPFGVDSRIEPLFAAADASPQETLAAYSDGSAAVAMRQTPQGLSIFVGPPGLTSQLLRLAARRSGVHLFTQTDCNVYANGPYLAVHASHDGPLEIDLGRAATVRDLLTGQEFGRGPKLVLPIKLGQTRVLKLE